MQRYNKKNDKGHQVTEYLRHMRVLNLLRAVPTHQITFPDLELKKFFDKQEKDKPFRDGFFTQLREAESSSEHQIDNFNKKYKINTRLHYTLATVPIMNAIRRFICHHFKGVAQTALLDFIFTDDCTIWAEAVLRYQTLRRMEYETMELALLCYPQESRFLSKLPSNPVIKPFHDFCDFFGFDTLRETKIHLEPKDYALFLHTLWSPFRFLMPDNYPVSPPSILQEAIDNKFILIENQDYLRNLRADAYYDLIFTLCIDLDGRVRVCEICKDGFWAYFDHQNTCSPKCSNVLSQRKRRAKQANREYQQSFEWKSSLSRESSTPGGHIEMFRFFLNGLSDEQAKIRNQTPYEIKKNKQREERKKLKEARSKNYGIIQTPEQ